MTKTIKIFISLAIFLILLFPVISFAQFVGPCPEGTYNNGTACVPNQSGGWGGLVPCNSNNAPVKNSDGTVTQPIPCDFNAFLALINTVIRFVLFYMAVPIAAIMFFYAGYLMVTSGGSSESKTKAKSIFSNTVLGLVFAAGAWLIIMTILSILGYEGAWIGFPK